MTLTPAATHQPQENVDPALLETPVGTMVEGSYQWREYCDDHATPILLRNPDKRHRPVSLYEVLTAYREYRCAHCKRLLWKPVNKEDV